MRVGLDSVSELVDQARGLYDDDPAALDLLETLHGRLREPLRIAVAGIVKAGKSTVLNALIGEKIAPTDAGECTRAVTWYRYARSPRITMRLREGSAVRLPIRRSAGSLVIDLAGHTAADVDAIDVEWPSEQLRRTVLIDTPGIASLSTDTSARTTRFLTPDETPPEADAIIYLLRHLHASDLKFLEAFRDTAAGPSQTVNAVAVLSRADEIGSGRIDSLLSAARIAERYRRDGELRALTLGVVPVAGLLAEGARTMRESEFIALKSLADMDRTARDRLLVSVDRFLRPSPDTSLSVEVRRALLSRFGIFGIRLGAAQIRAGARTSSALSERLVEQSGLIELQRFISDSFRSRAVALKTRGVLQALDTLLREKHRADAAALLGGIERISANNHELRELELIALARTTVLPLSGDDLAEAERVVGGAGTSPVHRLGLPDTADAEQLRDRIAALLSRWRSRAEAPLNDRATTHFCHVVIRSVEGTAAELGLSGRGASSDVVLASGPAQS